MEEKVESEHSYSGESSSSSDSSSGSSECDEEFMETIQVLGQTLELPQDLCEDYTVFREFFSMKTWESVEDKHKEELREHLPKFEENDEEEKETTIKMLFNHEPFHFTSPFSEFFNNLKQGNYRPDIAKMKKFLVKARTKQQKHKIKSYYAKLLPEVLLSRERLLAAAKAAPPGPAPRLPSLPSKPSSKSNYKPIYLRTRQRYFEELAAIYSEVGGEESEDENYPEGAPEVAIRKKKHTNNMQNAESSVSGTLGGLDPSHPTSLECLKNVLGAHKTRRRYRENHPELNTNGITLDDIKQRVSLMNGTKKLMFGGQKTETPIQKLRKSHKKETHQKQTKTDTKQSGKKGKEEMESVETRPLLPNIKIKCEQEESDSESSSFLDPVASPRQAKSGKNLEIDIKQEIPDSRYTNMTHTNFNDVEIKQEPPDSTMPNNNLSRICQPVPIKLEDLDGIDMMALPVELADDSGEVLPADTSTENEENSLDHDEALTETTHANFLSLVRALFPARAAHRASKQQLHSRCAAVMRSPIAPLNTWYNLADDWCAELNSALDFLAGERGPHPEDFVPYLQYMPETQMYQWIGAGRDCDAILGRLCERWLRAADPAPPSTEPPPPRYPTSWVVRIATTSELAEFRSQERRRFASATKPFTYVQHGYKAVVGPCAGAGGGARGACSAGASLLVPQRPRAAAFLPLVRDALARLPNGEGTRRDVVTLLKMSQWIVPCTDQALGNAVSAALDRLLTVKRDPVVKYDQRSTTWTYLHRHKSEEDWIKASKPRVKTAAAVAPAQKSSSTNHTPASSASTNTTLQSPRTPMEVDMGSMEDIAENASDSDVDVDDTSSSVPHLSSAQLLMQATQATQAKQQQNTSKSKGKLLATPPSKTKNTPKSRTPSETKQTSKPPTSKPPAPSKQAAQPAAAQPKPNALTKQPNMVNHAKTATILCPAKQTPVPPLAKQSPKQTVIQTKSVNVKQSVQSPKQNSIPNNKHIVVQTIKQSVSAALAKTASEPSIVSVSKTVPTVVVPPQKSPLIKQKQLLKVETPPTTIQPPNIPQQNTTICSVIQPPTAAAQVIQAKPMQTTQVTRSLLIRPPVVQTTSTPIVSTVTICTPSQATTAARRGVVRVLSPATPSSGKSLISPRALMQPNIPTAKKRTSIPNTTSATTTAQTSTSALNAISANVNSVATVVSAAGVVGAVSAVGAVGTRTVQLAGARTVQLANQTVHLPGGQAVQLASSALLSPLQLRGARPTLAGQVHIAGHVRLPAPSGPAPAAPHAAPALQTMQIAGQTVQLSGQTVQLASGQTVQLPGGQTVQLPSGQTVQLPSGQTVQLPSGQTVQLASGQTLQLPGGQTVHLTGGQTLQVANQPPKSIAQVVRTQTQGDKPAQPIVAKLLTNAQGQMVSLEGVMGARRGVRVLPPHARLTRPLLLTAAKPLHNIILQQSDGSAIRVTSSGGASTSQTIVLSNIGAQGVATSTTTTPVLKLQQAVSNATVPTSSNVRSVLMDGQQLKLVGGRHVLARLLRPAHPPQ